MQPLPKYEIASYFIFATIYVYDVLYFSTQVESRNHPYVVAHEAGEVSDDVLAGLRMWDNLNLKRGHD